MRQNASRPLMQHFWWTVLILFGAAPLIQLLEGFSTAVPLTASRTQPTLALLCSPNHPHHTFYGRSTVGPISTTTTRGGSSSTQLSLAVTGLVVIVDPSTVASTLAASAALIGSMVVGMQSDRWMSSSGILATLVTAATLSNLLLPGIIPTIHPLYDLCWSWVLPASLVLILLGNPVAAKEDTEGDDTSLSSSKNNNNNDLLSDRRRVLPEMIRKVGGPFVMATLGSLLGCWLAFYGWQGSFASVADARAATACLAASYIGGSVNLFATARILQTPSSLLSALATADLIVMACYFSGLSALLEWKWLRRKFGPTSSSSSSSSSDYDDSEDQQVVEQAPAGLRSPPKTLLSASSTSSSSSSSSSSSTRTRTSTTKSSRICSRQVLLIWNLLRLVAMVGGIVGVANQVEAWLDRWIPGMACAVIAGVTPWIGQQRWWRKMMMSETSSKMASTLAEGAFYLFFASIGMGVDLRATWRLGPSCLCLSLSALIVHLIVTLVGSWMMCCFFRTTPYSTRSGLEEVLIASNAAIGGPVTAAAFCARTMSTGSNKKGDPTTTTSTTTTSSSSLLWGRTVAATVWGVVGYATGTLWGVGLYRFLGR